MDKGSSNFVSEYKNKNGTKVVESEFRFSNSSCPSSHWQGKAGDFKRGGGKKRDRSPDKEVKKDSPHSRSLTNIKKEENSHDEEQVHSNSIIQQHHFQNTQLAMSSQQSLQSHSQQPTMAQSFPPYGYGVPDQYNTDPNQRSYPMMAPYNMYATMNPPWPSNQMEGMGMPPNTLQATSSIPVSTGMDMIPSTSAGINPYAAYMPMTGDMYMMGNYMPYPPMFPPDNSLMMPPVKETITLASCVLYPPHPGQHIKSRERHPGCKTVFVGGLPEKISEEIIREIFSRCGEINTVRMSKKNFCHVRFTAEAYVDEAMMLSGYRIKIENKDESAYSGRLHVDYAKARDDEYEWECLQRALQREARHRERKEQEASRPPTPPLVHYSEHEANQLTEKLKNEEHFKSATHILITWLERGECNRKTCGNFYSMIQCTNSHVKRLLNEKSKLEEKLSEAKGQMQQKMTSISLCFNEIYKVFETIQSLPSIMDSFTKTQRKEIEMMREKTLDIIKTHSRELVEERVEDEMELSEGEEEDQKLPANPSENSKGVSKEEVRKLQEELEELRKRYQNAVDRNASIKREIDSSSNAYAKILQEKNEEALAKQAELSELEKFKEEFLATQGFTATAAQPHEMRSTSVEESGNNMSIITQHEMSLIALIATFLNVHPFGASIDYICSYLIKIDPNVNSGEIESLLERFPNLFQKHTSGIGATLVKNWKFLGFSSRSD